MTLKLLWNLNPERNEVVLMLSKENTLSLWEEEKKPTKISLPERIQNIILSMKENVWEIINTNDFEHVLDYLQTIYKTCYLDISDDVSALLKNIQFKKYINEYISSQIPKILTNTSRDSFEDISFFTFLLWLWEYQNILIDINTYDFQKLDLLFMKYIWEISENKNNLEKFEVFFHSYINLFELMNKLSTLNEVDVWRKNLIPHFVKILNKSNTELEAILSESGMMNMSKKNTINHLTWKLEINFSHFSFIDVSKMDLHSVIHYYDEIIHKQVNGYKKAEWSHFWNNLSNKKSNYQAFIWNMAYTLSIMIYKMPLFEEKDILSNSEFIGLIWFFLKHIHFHKNTIDSIQELQEICTSIFTTIYINDDDIYNIKPQSLHWKMVIQDFISNSRVVNENQMESIHNLILFLPDISLDEYLEIGIFLVDTEKFNNFNFEFFKLKSLDIIISKLVDQKDENVRIFLAKLVIYIENNKIASQLFNTYSKLYLSIAFFYSWGFDKQSIAIALENFIKFTKMWWDELNVDKYYDKIEKLYYNIWLYHLNLNFCSTPCYDSASTCSTSNKACTFTKDQSINFWKKIVSHFHESYKKDLKRDLDRILWDLLENALNKNGIDDEEINRKITVVLSNKIFHWIAEIHIVNMEKKEGTTFISSWVLSNGIEDFHIDLFNGYKLFFIYPKIYESIFKTIYEKENYYIKRNIKNIITSYLKRKDLYIDHITWLPNESKLKLVLSNITWNLSFITLKLNTLRNINNAYTYDAWDEYVKNIAQELIKIPWLQCNVYRLSWAKIWITIEDSSIDIEKLITEIKNIKFYIWSIHYKLDAFMWITLNDKERIVEKSNWVIEYAKSVSNGVVYFQNENDDKKSSYHKELLEYLTLLDIAIEWNNLIPYYQPKIDVKTKKIVSYEALLRIKTKNWSIDSPYKYLLSAEYFWRLIAISDIMIEKVFQFASTNDAHFSINLSWDDLKNENLISHIQKINQQYNIDPSRIIFEILEWEWNEWGKDLLQVIKALKNLWFKIAMDDFWAMSSNINRLLDLFKNKEIDYLKIDGKIIQSLVDKDPMQANTTKKLLEWIISSAHSAWVSVIAEFIATQEIALICEFMWIDIFQWYYYWMPNDTLEIKKEREK